MNRKELNTNIEGYERAKSQIHWKYNTLDRLIESNDQDGINTTMAEISENESLIYEHGPTLARGICEFIQKDYIKDFPLNLNLDAMSVYDGIEKSLIDWGVIALQPSAIRPRFSDGTIEIVGTGTPGEYCEILTDNLLTALKGLTITNTVNITIFEESIKLGISGLKELLKLTGDKLRLMIDPETKYLIVKDSGSTFTVKPWAWDRAKGKKYGGSKIEYPCSFFGEYNHNRKIQLTTR